MLNSGNKIDFIFLDITVNFIYLKIFLILRYANAFYKFSNLNFLKKLENLKLNTYLNVVPPSITSECPVIQLAAFEHKKRQAPLKSVGCPMRESGLRLAVASRTSS